MQTRPEQTKSPFAGLQTHSRPSHTYAGIAQSLQQLASQLLPSKIDGFTKSLFKRANPDLILINQLAKKYKISPKTIRWYEEKGLLGKTERNKSGYRVYSKANIEWLSIQNLAEESGLVIDTLCPLIEKSVNDSRELR